jgi:ribonuclease HII
MPSWKHERAEAGIVAGIDEAGRGPAAGPVVAAAVVVLERRGLPRGLDDSKAIPKSERERLFEALLACAAKGRALIGVGAAEPEEIDRANILQASLRAMTRAVAQLPILPDIALVDGDRAPRLPCPTRMIVAGDSLSYSIAAASIVAKVVRDRLMGEAHLRWPLYGFDQHVGYPTDEHRAALAMHGPCPIHRRSWAPVKEAIARARGIPPAMAIAEAL